MRNILRISVVLTVVAAGAVVIGLLIKEARMVRITAARHFLALW